MDGIEKIIAKIEEDARRTSEAMIADAQKKALAITDEAREAGDTEARNIAAAGEAEKAKLISRAHSSGEHLKKKTVLARRVKIMDSVIERAVESFVRTNPREYFDSMVRLAKKYALPGKQYMIFSDKDMERLPEGFEGRVNSEILDGGEVTVRGGGGFFGGFLLVGDDVVENCTLAALVEEYDTEIRDELAGLLFKQ